MIIASIVFWYEIVSAEIVVVTRHFMGEVSLAFSRAPVLGHFLAQHRCVPCASLIIPEDSQELVLKDSGIKYSSITVHS